MNIIIGLIILLFVVPLALRFIGFFLDLALLLVGAVIIGPILLVAALYNKLKHGTWDKPKQPTSGVDVTN